MRIVLDKIIPHPLKEKDFSSGSVWSGTHSFENGQNYHVNAPSGSGKSTLVNIIYGLRKDFSGSLSFDHQKTSELNFEDWALVRKSKLAVIFQDLKLILDLSARENIQIKNQLTKRFKQDEIESFAEGLGILDLLDKQCALLSRGERQRVAIIRALAMPFEFLLLDEPFSHLDVKNTKLAIDLINKRCEEEGANLIMCNLHKDEHFKYDQLLEL